MPKVICEIITQIGKRVVEKTYPIPKAMEEGAEKAINELLKKEYIELSKSSWINNLRPVKKSDGTIRITTNFLLYRVHFQNT